MNKFLKPKTKKGNPIKKLPAAYPIVDQWEKSFKTLYYKNLSTMVMGKFKEIIKEAK